MAGKYRNKKQEVDGRIFDSQKEAQRYRELRLLEQGGMITNLRCQPSYELQPPFDYQGRKIRAITYRADYEYAENGKTIVEDVKGFKTKDFILKAKMFQYRYRDIELRLT